MQRAQRSAHALPRHAWGSRSRGSSTRRRSSRAATVTRPGSRSWMASGRRSGGKLRDVARSRELRPRRCAEKGAPGLLRVDHHLNVRPARLDDEVGEAGRRPVPLFGAADRCTVKPEPLLRSTHLTWRCPGLVVSVTVMWLEVLTSAFETNTDSAPAAQAGSPRSRTPTCPSPAGRSRQDTMRGLRCPSRFRRTRRCRAQSVLHRRWLRCWRLR